MLRLVRERRGICSSRSAVTWGSSIALLRRRWCDFLAARLIASKACRQVRLRVTAWCPSTAPPARLTGPARSASRGLLSGEAGTAWQETEFLRIRRRRAGDRRKAPVSVLDSADHGGAARPVPQRRE